MRSRRQRYLEKRKQTGQTAALIGICLLIALVGVNLYLARDSIFAGAGSVTSNAPTRPFVESGRIHNAAVLPAGWADSGPLFASSEDGKFKIRAYAPSGSLRWDREFSDTQLVAAQEDIIAAVGYQDNRLKLIDISGNTVMSTGLPGPASSVEIIDGFIAVASFNSEDLTNKETPGTTVEVYRKNGELVGSVPLEDEVVLKTERFPELGFLFLTLKPGVDGNEFILRAVSDSGELLWNTVVARELPVTAVDQSTANLIVAVTGKVFCLDHNGEKTWETSVPGKPLELIADGGNIAILVEGRSIFLFGKTHKLFGISGQGNETRLLYEGKECNMKRLEGSLRGLLGVEEGLVLILPDGTAEAIYKVDKWQDFSVNCDGSHIGVIDDEGNLRILKVAAPE